MPRFDMFKMSVLRIDQEARGDREGRALSLVGQAAEAERATDPDRPADVAEWDGPAVLLPLTAFDRGFES